MTPYLRIPIFLSLAPLLACSGNDDAIDCSQYDGRILEAHQLNPIGGSSVLSGDSVVVHGMFSKSMTFGQGQANETVLTTSNDSAFYLAKYQNGETLDWAKKIEATTNGHGSGSISALAVQSDSSFVITGWFGLYGSSMTFGPGEPNETTLAADDESAYLARFGSDGNLEWAKKFPSEVNSGQCIVSLSDTSFITAGFYSGSLTLGQDEENEVTLESNGNLDIYLARYKATGELVWAKNIGGDSMDYCYEIARFSDDSVVLTGIMERGAVFGAGEDNETIIEDNEPDEQFPAEDDFVAKFDSDGALIWAKEAIADNRSGRITSVAAGNQGEVYLTGDFWGPVIIGPGAPNETSMSTAIEDIFTAKFDSNGALDWATRVGTTDSGFGRIYSSAILPLTDGSAVITGLVIDNEEDCPPTAVFGAGTPNEASLTVEEGADAYIAKYGPQGTFEWLEPIRGKSDQIALEAYSLPNDTFQVVLGTGSDLSLCAVGQDDSSGIVLEAYKAHLLTLASE